MDVTAQAHTRNGLLDTMLILDMPVLEDQTGWYAVS